MKVRWDGNGASKNDAALIMFALCDQPLYTRAGKNDPSLVNELEARGYDITTLRFSIRKKTNTVEEG